MPSVFPRSFLVLILGGSAIAAQAAAPRYPAGPPAAIKIHKFAKVSDALFRGAQPDLESGAELNALHDLGIKTIIDLHNTGKRRDAEEKAVRAARMEYVSIPLNSAAAPSAQDVKRALDLIRTKGPAFVHCREGVDRTGTIVACYRIATGESDAAAALHEAETRGMHFWEISMKRFIRSGCGFEPPARPATPVALLPASVTPPRSNSPAKP